MILIYSVQYCSETCVNGHLNYTVATTLRPLQHGPEYLSIQMYAFRSVFWSELCGHLSKVYNSQPRVCPWIAVHIFSPCTEQLLPYKERLVIGKTTNLAAMIIANWFHFSITLPTFQWMQYNLCGFISLKYSMAIVNLKSSLFTFLRNTEYYGRPKPLIVITYYNSHSH